MHCMACNSARGYLPAGTNMTSDDVHWKDFQLNDAGNENTKLLPNLGGFVSACTKLIPKDDHSGWPSSSGTLLPHTAHPALHN